MEVKGREKAGHSRFSNLREFSWHVARGLWYNVSSEQWRSRSWHMDIFPVIANVCDSNAFYDPLQPSFLE